VEGSMFLPRPPLRSSSIPAPICTIWTQLQLSIRTGGMTIRFSPFGTLRPTTGTLRPTTDLSSSLCCPCERVRRRLSPEFDHSGRALAPLTGGPRPFPFRLEAA
jgi:hypothetical protein